MHEQKLQIIFALFVQCIQSCCQAVQAPIEPPDGQAALRVGCVYALAIRTYAATASWPQAARLLADMAARGIPASSFLEAPLLESVYAATGQPVPVPAAAEVAAGDRDDASVVSEVDSL